MRIFKYSLPTLLGGGISKTPRLAVLAELPHAPVHALGARPYPLRTVGVIVAAAVRRTVRAGPAQVALAHVVGRALALAVHARLVAGARARQLAVAHEPLAAVAAERAVRVRADGVVVAVVQPEAALVHVRALRVRPARVRHAERVRAPLARVVEVALYTHAWNGTRMESC